MASKAKGKISPKRDLQPTALVRDGSARPDRGLKQAWADAPPPAGTELTAGDGSVMGWARGGSPRCGEGGLGLAKDGGRALGDKSLLGVAGPEP